MVLDPAALEDAAALKGARSWVLVLAVLLVIDAAFMLWICHDAVPAPLTFKPGWRLLLSREGMETFAQWDSPVDAGMLPAGRLRVPPGSPLHANMPRMSPGGLDRFEVRRTSAMAEGIGPASGDADEWIIHDDWSKRDGVAGEILPLEGPQGDWTILLDSSGTMSETLVQGDGTSRYRTALRALAARRKASSAPWHVYTFAGRLQDHGTWGPGQSGAFLADLPRTHGNTSLLSALGELRGLLRRPACLVIVTDGEIDQRDRASVLRLFSSLRADGHDVSLLSPALEALGDYGFAYDSGHVGRQWPVPALQGILKESRTAGHQDLGWLNVAATRSQGRAVPVLFSPEGRPLLYHVPLPGGRHRFHAAGEPVGGIEAVRSLLEGTWTRTVTLMLERGALSVDLHCDSLEPLLVLQDEWQTLELQAPGLHRLEVRDWNWRELAFQHPVSGPFTLYNLDIMERLESPDEEMTDNLLDFGNFWRLPSANAMALAWVLAFLHLAAFAALLMVRPRSVVRQGGHVHG